MHIAELIEQRERALLQTDWNANPKLIDEFLAVEFEEISGNGQITTRQDVVSWLMHKKNDAEWSLMNFRIKMLTDEIVLANYSIRSSVKPGNACKGSMRTSIWQLQQGQWKMIFHQAIQFTDP
ncbi:DUF4440 domain-containing protein [Nitrosomonas sp. JL21]|uniref:nuclear transport factor 2 family protein n=1 Tax=Nitrosomonas sp. JL21 TaxID=153949 RepID=UPI0013718768|nr:DUF4440 domain-containing protein [Nitrosomonas sp. JL21]MBL8497819.1 DUF4440 domain-containing protein [Nitrosomonas sp.]